LIIPIRVTTRSKKERVEGPDDQGVYHIWVSAPPADGAANQKVCLLIANFFKVAKTRVQIIKGQSSRLKQVEIFNEN
jgi:uncharacterized protein (TIGR00251 family)